MHDEEGLYIYGRRAGRTPRLVYDPAVIVRQYRRFTAAFPGADLFFPVKCCPVPVALLTIAGQGAGFEVASAGEVRLLRDLDLPTSPAVFGAPTRSIPDAMEAYRAGVGTYVVDAVAEVEKLAALEAEIDVLIRLSVESSDTTMPLSTKFGVSQLANRDVVRAVADSGLPLRGFVFHVGSQTRSAEPWAAALRRVADARDIAAAAGLSISAVDISGGFPVSYRGAPVAEVEQIADTVYAALARTGLDELDLIVEPGRYLVAPAAELHGRVLATTTDDNHARAVLDFGVFNGLHEVTDGVDFQYAVAEHDDGDAPSRLWQLAGPSCDGKDIIASDRTLPATMATGDIIVVPDAGAYTASYASDFCGLDTPTHTVLSPRRGPDVTDGVVRANSGSDLADVAREIEATVFGQRGFTDDDGTLDSYRKYDDHSVFNIAFKDGRAVGVAREIWPSSSGLKTLNEMETWPSTEVLLNAIGHDRVGDVGTTAVLPDYTGTDVLMWLTRSLFYSARSIGFTHWIAGIDDVVLAYMRHELGFNFIDLGPSVDYFGSSTTPVIGERRTFTAHAMPYAPQYWGAVIDGPPPDPRNDFVAPLSWEDERPAVDTRVVDLRERARPAPAPTPTRADEPVVSP